MCGINIDITIKSLSGKKRQRDEGGGADQEITWGGAYAGKMANVTGLTSNKSYNMVRTCSKAAQL